MKDKLFDLMKKSNDLLNTNIKPVFLYFYILKRTLPFKTVVNYSDVKNFNLEIRNQDTIKSEISINKLRPKYVLIRNKLPEFKVITKEFKYFFNKHITVVRNLTKEFIRLKWNYTYFDFFTLARNYNLKLKTCLNDKNSPNAFKKLFCTVYKLDKKHFKLEFKTVVLEELISILPYIKNKPAKTLCRLPIIKEPLIKSCFSYTEYEKFRDALATQNNTRKGNIEVQKVYDRLNPKIFQTIKPDEQGKKLLCYPLSEMINDKKHRMYYLITGKRKDNGEGIKAIMLQEKHNFKSK